MGKVKEESGGTAFHSGAITATDQDKQQRSAVVELILALLINAPPSVGQDCSFATAFWWPWIVEEKRLQLWNNGPGIIVLQYRSAGRIEQIRLQFLILLAITSYVANYMIERWLS